MVKLIFGCGFLGARVARLWQEAGDEVWAVTRSASRAEWLRGQDIKPIVADVTRPASLDELPPSTSVLYAIGYDRAAGHTMREVYVDGLRRALEAISPLCQKLIFVSSTSVYAQQDGGWVDETSICEPVAENGRVCLAAERALAEHALGQRAIVLRLAGIYGPGRIPRRAALAAGEVIAAPEQGYVNLIHVDDAARIVLAAERLTVPPPRLYTVSDGQPAIRRDYFAELARLAGGPAPRFALPAADDASGRRAQTDKRVANAALLADLGIILRYPSYREGLAAIVAAESG